MSHEEKAHEATEKLDKLFADNDFSEIEKALTKAAIIAVLSQRRAAIEFDDDSLNILLASTYSAIFGTICDGMDVTDNSRKKSQEAAAIFDTMLHNDKEPKNEYRKSH